MANGANFDAANPETETISLFLPDVRSGPLTITNFTEYSFTSHFLTPSDAFSFTIADDALTDAVQRELVPGVRVQLHLNDSIQATGYIDSIAKSASRDSGRVWRIRGRDALAHAVDAHADPTISIKEGQSISDLVKTWLGPFGWKNEDQFSIDASADNDVRLAEGFRTHAKTAKGQGKALNRYVMKRARPEYGEGVFEYTSKLAQRQGLWLWCSADGQKIIVAKPNFAQEPSYEVRRDALGGSNVLDGEVEFDLTDQPTAIVARTSTQNYDFAPGAACAIMYNAAVECTDPTPAPLKRYIDAGAKVIAPDSGATFQKMRVPYHRIMYLHDPHAATQEELETFVRREMALLQRKSVTARYTVMGHSQVTPSGKKVWTPDTTVSVKDSVAGLSEVMYVLGRTLRQSRNGGTTTDLELIRLNTLVFAGPAS